MAEIDHVHFLCTDPEPAAAFFRDHFGATELGRITYPDWLIIRLQLGKTVIALSPPRTGEAVTDQPPRSSSRFYHLGIRVSGIDSLAERLRRAGVSLSGDPRDVDGKARVAYVSGPGGIELELLEAL